MLSHVFILFHSNSKYCEAHLGFRLKRSFDAIYTTSTKFWKLNELGIPSVILFLRDFLQTLWYILKNFYAKWCGGKINLIATRLWNYEGINLKMRKKGFNFWAEASAINKTGYPTWRIHIYQHFFCFQYNFFGVFVVSLLLTLNIFHTLFCYLYL